MGKSYLDKLFESIDTMCDKNKGCVMFVFIVAGILLCWSFKDGFTSLDQGNHMDSKDHDHDDNHGSPDHGGEVKEGVQGTTIGLKPKPKGRDHVPPSMKPQMEIQGEAKEPDWNAEPQQSGLKIQDGSIAAPFNEIWNTGYQSVDMVFQDAKPLDTGHPTGNHSGHTGESQGEHSGGSINLTLYHAPWCPHCINMMPAFTEFEQGNQGRIIDGKVLHIKTVNSDDEPDTVKENNVTGFPTITWNGKTLSDFPRGDAKSMTTYVETH